MDELPRSVDVVATSSVLELPCRLGDPEQIALTYARHLWIPFSLTGVPAMAVPTGFTEDGLQLGTLIAAGSGWEAVCYRVAGAYAGVVSWGRRRARL